MGGGSRDRVSIRPSPWRPRWAPPNEHRDLDPGPGGEAPDMKLEVGSSPCPTPSGGAVLRVAGMARGRRLRPQRGPAGPAVHAARLAGVDHLRHRRHAHCARLGREPAPRRRRRRRGSRRADRARRRRARGLPRHRVQRGPAAACPARTRSASPRLVRSVQRPRRQRVAAPGGHHPSARARGRAGCRRAGRPAARDGAPPRPLEQVAPPTTGGTGTRPPRRAASTGSTPEQADAVADLYMKRSGAISCPR